MLELIGNEKTFGLVFFNIMLMLIIFWCFKEAKVYPYIIKSKAKKNLGIICIFLFFLFAFWGSDWFHIAEFYPYLRAGERTHMEDIYQWIAQNVAPDYLTFRTIVWGVCLLLVKLIIDRLDVQKDLLWFMFVVFGVVWCSYARVSLAMCLMYYGFTLLFKPYKYKYLSYLIALSAIVASYYCHKTALFGIVLVVLATLIRNFNRRSIVLLVLSVPIIYMLLQTVISDYLLFDATGDDGSWNKSVVSAQGYMEREASVVGIGALLLKIVERSAYIVTGSMAAFMILKDKNNKRSPVINAFFRLDIIMVLISCLFLLDLGINASIIAERFFRFLFIPTGIIIAYFWQIRFCMRYTKLIYILGIAYSSYALLYSFYMFI